MNVLTYKKMSGYQIAAHNDTRTIFSWKSQKVGVRDGVCGSCIVIIHHIDSPAILADNIMSSSSEVL